MRVFLRFVVGLNGKADEADFSQADAIVRRQLGEDTQIVVVPLALAEMGDAALVVFSDLQGRDHEGVVGFEVYGSVSDVQLCVQRLTGELGVQYPMLAPKFRVRNTRTSEPIGVMPWPDCGTTLGWLAHPELEMFGIGRLSSFSARGEREDIEMFVGAL